MTKLILKTAWYSTCVIGGYTIARYAGVDISLIIAATLALLCVWVLANFNDGNTIK